MSIERMENVPNLLIIKWIRKFQIEPYFNNDKSIVKQEQKVSLDRYIEKALVGLDDIWRKVRNI